MPFSRPLSSSGSGNAHASVVPDEAEPGKGQFRHWRPSSIFRALRHPNYRLYFFGQMVSVCGTWMQMMAQSWLVYRLTGSGVLLGTVSAFMHIPVFLLSPFGGMVCDRFRRRNVLLATQIAAMLQALLLAGLTLTGWIQVWHLLGLAAMLGVINAFAMPARQSFVVEMVGREDLINAIALNSSMFNMARIIGPAIAGSLVAVVGEGWCFFANAVSFLAVIASLLLMRMPARTRSRSLHPPLHDFLEGIQFAFSMRPVRALLILMAVFSLMGMPYGVLMPIFADKILNGGPKALGLLTGAAGLGAMLGALILAAHRGLRGLETWIVCSIAAFGLALVLFSLSRSFWLSVGLLVLVGFGQIGQTASSNTLIQSVIPDHLRGRVMAAWTMMFAGMAPFGALLAGVLSDHIGAPATVAIGGLACMAGAAIFALRLGAFRHDARRMIVALETAGGDPAEEDIAGPESAQIPTESLLAEDGSHGKR
ncbi:MFS transporter [bacterium]|nr:MFS transporter [bacterium]